ncbi:MAG TPA: inositol monophosphatase [Azoarcus sp.]|nr:inositol monophosphatase [Azoarcus sp.]
MPNASHRLSRARALETLVRDIAREIILPRYLRTVRQSKSDGTLFTEADLESQHHFSRELPSLFGGLVLGEEMTSEAQLASWDAGRAGLWCIDPIDGTTNFINGIPFFAVSVAYLVEHEPHFGVVYNPVTDESFCAAKGAGAWLNGTPLPLRSAAQQLEDAVAGVDGKRLHPALNEKLMQRPPFYSQRNFGSSALEWCYTAAGRLDVYIHGGQMLWDHAAGQLILSEAGGIGMALDGAPLMSSPSTRRTVIAAANLELFSLWHRWLVPQPT